MGKISNFNESITEDFRNVINLDNLRRFKDKFVALIQGLLTTKQDTIADLDTIRNNSNEGHTAYDWGNHTLQGYITKSVNDLINYYTKNDIYTKSEVQTLIDADKAQIHMRVVERDSELIIVSNIPLNNFADNSIALARKGFWDSGGNKADRTNKHGWRFVGAYSDGHRYIGKNVSNSRDLRNVDIKIIDSYKPVNHNFYINTFTIGGITPSASNITSLITQDNGTHASIYNGKKKLTIKFGINVGDSGVKFTVYRIHLGIGIPQFNCIAPFNVVLSLYNCYDYTTFLKKVAFELKSGI